jgi:hypothetical protein
VLILNTLLFLILIIFYASTALEGLGLPVVKVPRSHSIDTPHGVGRPWTSDRSVAEILLPDNIQHSQEKNIRALGGIRTLNPSKRAAADSHLRPRSYRHFWYNLPYSTSDVRWTDCNWQFSHNITQNHTFVLMWSEMLGIKMYWIKRPGRFRASGQC